MGCDWIVWMGGRFKVGSGEVGGGYEVELDEVGDWGSDNGSTDGG